MPQIDPLDAAVVEFFHHRWNLPTVRALVRSSGARVVSLVHELGVARSVLRVSIDALGELGLVEPNPGHGHPLRPEFLPTRRGRDIDAPSEDYLNAVDAPDLATRKWTAPVIGAVADDDRFNAIQRRLGVSPRALSQTLEALADAGLVVRETDDGRPPRSRYALTKAGARASEAVTAMARVLTRTGS